MKLLDLYCGGGGAAVGYHRAGFDEIVGVDQVRQPDYPFSFVLGNADTYPLDGFDAIHASPPCKAHTRLHARDQARDRLFDPHTDHLTPTLDRLAVLDVPWVVENVPGAPMPSGSVTYCGSSFGLPIRRHRLFASNVPIVAPVCDHGWQTDLVGVYGHTGGSSRRDGVTFADYAAWCAAMDIYWLPADRLSQAIPPVYTERIGAQLLGDIEHARAPRLDGMPSTATDLRYGRRGGGWLPPGYTEHTEDRHCPVCDGLLTVGQDVHQACAPLVLTLFGDDE